MTTKQASTPLPLSPEESQEASRLFGRSLFSALQLAREQEYKKQLAEDAIGDDDGNVLRIPIPSHLMPAQNKMAEQAAETAGDVNAGKYLGGFLGTAAGAGLGAGLRNTSRGLLHAMKRTGQGGLAGGLLGLGAGALLDKSINKPANEPGNIDPEVLQRLIEAEKLKQLESEMMYPSEKMASYADAVSPGIFARAFKTSNEPLQMLAGGQEGFREAKKEYYLQEKSRIQKELMDAQKEYISMLSKIKTGSAEEATETPCVDAFCNGLAYAALFDKSAEHSPEIEEGSLSRLLGDAMGVAKKPFQPAVDAAATGLLGTAAGSAYLTYMLRKKMREEPEKYMQEGLPTRVELQPYV